MDDRAFGWHMQLIVLDSLNVYPKEFDEDHGREIPKNFRNGLG
jgi:hypothetical protein